LFLRTATGAELCTEAVFSWVAWIVDAFFPRSIHTGITFFKANTIQAQLGIKMANFDGRDEGSRPQKGE
jgi:hypothetical protein